MHDTGVTFVGNEKCRLNGVLLVVDIYRTSVVGGTRVEGLVGHLADHALKSHMKYAESYYLFLCTNKNFASRFENTFEITHKNAEVYSYYFFLLVRTRILLTDWRIPLKSHMIYTEVVSQ